MSRRSFRLSMRSPTSPGIHHAENNSKDVENLVVRLVEGTGMPKSDGPIAKCDPYVKMWLEDEKGNRKHDTPMKWPAKFQTLQPLWNSCRCFGHAKGTDVLHVEVWDEDLVTQHDFVGTARIPVWALLDAQQNAMGPQSTSVASLAGLAADSAWFSVRVFPPEGKRGAGCSIGIGRSHPKLTVGLLPLPAQMIPTRKTLFLVRHGQSVWNKAQADKDVVGLVSQTDHPLNSEGIEQARALCAKLTPTNADALSQDEHDFLAAKVVVSSPLTRAIQTAIVGVFPVITATNGTNARAGAPTLKLAANAREKRNMGGRDSSGSACGEVVKQRVMRTMQKLVSAEDMAKYRAINFDLFEVRRKWWIDHKERQQDVDERMDDLMWQVRFMPEQHIVLVGHSHFFRSMMQRYLSTSFSTANAELAASLQERVVENCGVMRVDLDFACATDVGREETQMAFPGLITDVRFLFGSKLKS